MIAVFIHLQLSYENKTNKESEMWMPNRALGTQKLSSPV